jgi:hypothetical protein
MKELFEWEDGDFEQKEIFFDTSKAGVLMEYHGLANIIV